MNFLCHPERSEGSRFYTHEILHPLRGFRMTNDVNLRMLRIKNKQMKGFTMIEFLLVMGILLLVSALSFPLYNNWLPRTVLSSVQAELLQSIREVQALSRGGKEQSRYGLYFDSVNNSYLAYQGDDYVSRDPDYDRLVNLENNISLALDWGGAELNFATSTGAPSATGTISIINAANNESKIIIINQFGPTKE